MRKLTDEDYRRAAAGLGCTPAAVRAVVEVESSGGGFLRDGRPKVLFERHIFRRQLIQRGIDPAPWEATLPNIVSRKRGGYKGGGHEHDRLASATQIDREAALKSCSWGMFQIMGFNWRATGAKSLQDFINAMYRDEASQLDLFVHFLYAEGLDDEMRDRRWADFAEKYNGPAYRENRYDEKLALAYEKWSRA